MASFEKKSTARDTYEIKYAFYTTTHKHWEEIKIFYLGAGGMEHT